MTVSCPDDRIRFLTVTDPIWTGENKWGKAVTRGTPFTVGVPVLPATWFDGPVAPHSEQLVALLQKAWQGEWYGVRVYGELAAQRSKPDETATLLELVVLETYVLGELTIALLGLGLEPDLGPVEAEADADLAEHSADDWTTLIEWLKSDAEVALEGYLPLPELAAGDDTLARLAALVVDHERALVTFANRTLAGESGAMSDIRALVRVEQ
jgi:hypothetical protein